MFLLDLYESISGAASIIIALVLIVLVFKIGKGIVKTILSLIVLGLIAVAVLSFMGII